MDIRLGGHKLCPLLVVGVRHGRKELCPVRLSVGHSRHTGLLGHPRAHSRAGAAAGDSQIVA